ncbi:HECT domain containing 2 [Plakobranchus ocellatus]|uniref:HECT domain containing 2 n=1 Tax=Plakobranchus ocellatus TaxID=259542 RepID=A0AAV4E187_9GAST|nr:HECT domain containing 2 [Plakobranchus ocellatus]
MASPNGSHQNEGLVTCPTCDYTVTQAPGKKRTICPNCGNFYSKEAAEIATTYRRNRPRQHQNDSQSSSTTTVTSNRGEGNRQHVLSNFFQTLRPGGRKASSGDISSDTSDKDTLPRIEPRSQLTTPNQNSVPSYLTPVRGDGTSHSPCGGNCIHHKRSTNCLRSSHGHMDNADGLHHPSSNSLHGKDIYSGRHSPRIISPRLTPSNTTPRGGDGNSCKPQRTADQLKSDFLLAKETGNWRPLLEFYSITFGSFSDVNTAFKRDPSKEYKSTEDPGLKFDFINLVYDILIKTPQGLQKEVLKAVINSLLKDKSPQQGDLRLLGPPSGQGVDGRVRTCDRRVPADLASHCATNAPHCKMLI